jgi:RHS repeat-associated protein
VGGKIFGKEKGASNTYDFGARIYNPRIARFLSVDPADDEFPWNSPYAFAENRVIDGVDLKGREWKDADGKTLTEPQLQNVRVFIFYDGKEKGFSEQTLKQYAAYEKQFGKGSVALSKVSTAQEFCEDWANMGGKNILLVSLNVHGSNQALHIDHVTGEYIVSTEDGKTNGSGTPGLKIEDLPDPKGDISKAKLEINSCHSADYLQRNQMELIFGDEKTVYGAFVEYTEFDKVRGSIIGVNYNTEGEAFTRFPWIERDNTPPPYSPNWEHTCFIAGTKVLMADGSEKTIETIKTGDKILSVNISNMNVETDLVEAIPTKVKEYRKIKMVIANGIELEFSPAHPFWVVGKGWCVYDSVEAEDELSFDVKVMKKGDKVLQLVEGRLIEMEIIKLYDTKEKEVMYNVEFVKKNHSFFANGVLVHNKYIGGGEQ